MDQKPQERENEAVVGVATIAVATAQLAAGATWHLQSYQALRTQWLVGAVPRHYQRLVDVVVAVEAAEELPLYLPGTHLALTQN